MKLLNVKLQNYRRWSSLTLDLAGLGGVVVTGDNGTGKSSLIEAILWALYGVSRSDSVDRVVKLGATDAVVTVEVEAAGQRYRVTRKRTLRGSGKSELDLYRCDSPAPTTVQPELGDDQIVVADASGMAAGGGALALPIARPRAEVWTPLSGKKLADTQAEIERVIGVSYDTLVAASVVQQGDAGRFTRARPEERRAVLRSILKIETWKERARAGRERARTIEAEADALARDIDASARASLAPVFDLLLEGGLHRVAFVNNALGSNPASLLDEGLERQRAAIERLGAELEQAQRALDEATAGVGAARERDTAARAALQAAEARAAERPRHQKVLDEARSEAADLALEALDLRRAADLTEIEAAERDLPAARERLADAERRLAAAQDVAERRADLDRQRAALITRYQDAAHRQKQAEAEAAGLEDVRARAAGLEDARARRDAAAAEMARLEAEIDRLAAEARAVDERPEVVEARARRDEAERALAAAQERLTALGHTMSALTAAKLHADRVAADLDRARRGAERLQQVPCGDASRWLPAPDGDVAISKACDLAGTCPLLADARAAAAQIPGLEQAVAEARAAVTLAERRDEEGRLASDAAVEAKAAADAARRTFEAVRLAVNDVITAQGRQAADAQRAARRAHDEAREAATSAELAAARLPGMEAAAERAAAARAEAEAITAEGREVKARLDALAGETPETAERIAQIERGEVERLQTIAARRPAAEKAAADLAQLPERRARVEARIVEAQTALDACAVPQQLRDDRALAAHALTSATVSENAARMEAGAKGQRLAAHRATADRLQADLDALAEKRAEVDRLRDVAAGWRATVEACELAPTLLIERAIPVLEAEANRVLADVSPRGLQVRIDTQRALKSGDGVAETLDIIARDEAGERPYEDFSGGEQFRLDIALRLALAKLLADRDGVPVEWLCIDEGGFGALDASGKAALKDAVAALQPRYALILLVTHIEEVADALPWRLHVEDDGAGGSRTAWNGAPAAMEAAA